ncbi:MAG: hypothetical protein AAGD25_24425 [Cyanobacteria bacterium P01_F01_bin.150]
MVHIEADERTPGSWLTFGFCMGRSLYATFSLINAVASSIIFSTSPRLLVGISLSGDRINDA